MPYLRVATLNLHQRRDRWPQRRELVLGALVDLHADLIALQEISVIGRQGRWLHKQLNYRLSGNASEPYQMVQRSGRHPLWGTVEGVAILTRLPVISADAQSLGQDGRVALRVNTAASTGAPLDFVAVQLNPALDAHETREKQIMALLGWINKPGAVAHQIIAGSFEDAPDQLALRRIKQFYRYRSAFEVKMGHEPAATFPTALVEPQINAGRCHDYIFLSSAFSGVADSGLFARRSAENDDTLYASDHIGVWADILV
jgi:endonuclease/exonuclease/phosphatase family metal-dependent hydrolase